MKNRKIALASGIVAMSLALAACGSNASNNTSNGHQSSSTDSSTNASESASNTPKEKVPVTMVVQYNPNLFSDLETSFEKANPDIDLQLVFMDNAQANKVLNAQFAAGEGPDIAPMNLDFFKLGYALELNDQPFIDRLSDGAKLATTQADGSIFSVPFETWFQGIMYNKKIFADNGIEIPKTWDQFIAISEKLKAAGIKPLGVGDKDGDVIGKMALGVVLSTGAIIEPDIESAKTTYSASWKTGLDKFYEVVSKGIIGTDAFGMSVDDMVNEFLTGKSAMISMGSWQVADMHKKAPDLDFDIFPYPSVAEGQDNWAVGGVAGGGGVNAHSKHIDEALRVLDYIASPEGDAQWIAVTHGGPVIKGTQGGLDPSLSGLQDTLGAGRTYAPWEGFKKINGENFVRTWFKTSQEIVSGKKTVDEGLQAVDDYVSKQLAALK
ncbi:ABC transporter substrate-binding protein [Cohnella rhizosphaerae]|uniref:Extracellular solute-binding protein n=1 Tax=Cohnella rhizosphaerae TaxID=1457232 RepID=A0A9X4KSI7_9BACL|nr:extracellular solute-binding protein [Cohnella rhizosphaerae]MDG0810379.1 extracellular solute-binding protein [Cohnella rhizosphaerae]